MDEVKPAENIVADNKPPRDEHGRLLPGFESLNPLGRGSRISIKTRIRTWLDDHPEDMAAFVEHFVKNNIELAWQMLEGRPSQDVTSAGEKIIVIPPELIAKNEPHDKPGDNSPGQPSV